MPTTTASSVTFPLDRATVELIADRLPQASVQRAARAWLHAFESTRARGADDAEARVQANRAWDRACATDRARPRRAAA